jgi:hypothetical protein
VVSAAGSGRCLQGSEFIIISEGYIISGRWTIPSRIWVVKGFRRGKYQRNCGFTASGREAYIYGRHWTADTKCGKWRTWCLVFGGLVVEWGKRGIYR